MNNSGNHKQQVFVKAALNFAEALYMPEIEGGEKTNIFGRSISLNSKGGLSRIMGTSSTGLRSAAFLNANELYECLNTLSSFARFHIPITLVVDGDSLGYLPQLTQSGALIFQTHSPQELSDWVLMAQVISEKSLMPVVVLCSFKNEEHPVILPAKNELREWFGDNDGRVKDPTPAQTMAHGKMRRRMPAWIQTDTPVMLGARKNHRDKLIEQAARQQYEQIHIQEIIQNTMNEFSKQFHRHYEECTTYNLEKAHKLVLTTTQISPAVATDLIASKAFKKERIGIVVMNQLWPISLPDKIKTTKLDRWVVLEPAVYKGDQGWLYKEVLAGGWLSYGKGQNGWYVNPASEEAWTRVLQNLINQKDYLHKYWLDIAFDRSFSPYPKYEVLVQSIKRYYPQAQHASLLKQSSDRSVLKKPTPLAAKRFVNMGPPYSRLNRFSDDTACLYDQPEQQVVHPFDAVPVLPAASAIYNYPANRSEFPVFHPQKLKDVGRYPAVCPHGALFTGLLSIQELIKAGITQARKRGEAISLLVPLSKVWAKNATLEAHKNKNRIQYARDILIPAFEKTRPLAKKDPQLVEAEYEQIMLGIGQIPLSLTETHFYAREEEKPESGEIFTLAIDPITCTGCGSCAIATAEGAIEMKPQDLNLEALATAEFGRFDSLPDTSENITKRLIEDEQFDSFSALLLNKSLYRNFSRSGITWQKSAENSTAGMLIALIEFNLSKNYESINKQISIHTTGINNGIKKILSDALPVTKLDSLMEVITQHSEDKLNMDQVFNEWGNEQQFKAVKKDDLQRKLEVIEGLKQLKWALKDGNNGFGRSTYSIVLDSSIAYLGENPWNAFNVPVIQAEQNETADIAHGLFEGELRYTLDNIRLLRRAELEAANKYQPEKHNKEIAALAWGDLTEEEKALVTPVFVLCTDDLLGHKALQPLLRLMEQGYPIKVLTLESGTINPQNATSDLGMKANALWPIIAQNRAFVGRASLADANTLFKLLNDGIDFPGPAVVSAFTPDAYAYDTLPALWPKLATLAESSRTFLPFRFTPGAKSTANRLQVYVPNIKTDWISTTLNYRDKDTEKQTSYTLTYADYAYLLKSWKSLFIKLESETNTIDISEYLDLDPSAAQAAIPVIKRVDTASNLVLYRVSDEVIDACRTVQNNFRLLREWAGLYTEFPDKLKEEVDADLRQEYDKEKSKFLADLEAEKATWEAEHLDAIKKQMKERLLKMTGQL